MEFRDFALGFILGAAFGGYLSGIPYRDMRGKAFQYPGRFDL